MRDHARRRNAVPRTELDKAPRGAGIISVAGPVLGLFQEDLAYLEAQDLVADGAAEEAA